MSVPHMISGDGNISLVINGEQFYVAHTDDRYDRILTTLNDENASEEDLMNVLDRVTVIKDYVHESGIEVKDGVVYYKEHPVHNGMTARILRFLEDDLPVAPLVAFLANLMENPSYTAREQLYDFLEHKSLPITEDGHFLAYKAVNAELFDKHTGTLKNDVGTVVEMPRWGVDDERGHGCSAGLHAGTLDYVQGYGCFHEGEGSDVCLIVKINPADVVSIPSDCECQKLRTCKYFVLKLYEGEMEYNLSTEDGEEWEEDEDFDDGAQWSEEEFFAGKDVEGEEDFDAFEDVGGGDGPVVGMTDDDDQWGRDLQAPLDDAQKNTKWWFSSYFNDFWTN